MQAIKNIWRGYGALMLVTFELFWIVVFLLDRLTAGSGGGIPQFVYVNF